MSEYDQLNQFWYPGTTPRTYFSIATPLNWVMFLDDADYSYNLHCSSELQFEAARKNMKQKPLQGTLYFVWCANPTAGKESQ